MGEAPTTDGGDNPAESETLDWGSDPVPSNDEPADVTPDGEPPRFTDTRILGRWLIGALIVGMLIRGVAMGSAWVMRNWTVGGARPKEGSFAVLEGLAIGGFLVSVLVACVTGILWVIWLWYAYSNLRALKRRPEHPRVWVWLGWFVPIWSLFRPKQLHDEVWRSGGDESVPGWLHFWWFSFLAALLSLNAVSEIEYSWADVVANALGIVASIFAVAVVWISAARQWNRRRSLEGAPPDSTRNLAIYGAAGAGVVSFGLAALFVVLPHSEELPEGTTVVSGLLDVAPGECFTADDLDGSGLMWIVDCSTPHIGEAVGAVEFNSFSYPGFNALVDFGTFGCWSAFYEYAGDTADNLDYLLDWYSPLEAAWAEGYSSISCVVSHIDGRELSTSVADPNSPWIGFENLRVGACYDFHDSLLAAAERPCGTGGLKLGNLKQYTNDPLIEYPGDALVNTQISCEGPEANWPITPNVDTWPLGDRVSLCMTEEPESA